MAKQIMTAIVNSKVNTSTLSIFLLDTTMYAAQKISPKTIPEPKSCMIRLDLTLDNTQSAVFGLSALISPLSSDSLPYSGSAKFPSLIFILVIFHAFQRAICCLSTRMIFTRSFGRAFAQSCQSYKHIPLINSSQMCLSIQVFSKDCPTLIVG